MQKTQKTYTAEFKREAVAWRRPVGNRSRRLLVNWAFQTPRSINGAKNWQNTGPKRSQEAGIRRRWRKKIVDAPRELERVRQERDILKKTVGLFASDQR